MNPCDHIHPMYLKKIFYSSIIAEVFDSFKLNVVIPVWFCVSLPGSCTNLLGLNTDELADEIYLARGIIFCQCSDL
jgi:hypothetical protein